MKHHLRGIHGAMRPHRRRDHPYLGRKRDRRPTWREVLDAICWAIGVAFVGSIAVWALWRSVSALNGLWQ